MSLKARLRLAVALLMSLMAAALCGLYIRSYLRNAFERTEEISRSIVNQVQAGVLEELERKAALENPPPSTPEEATAFWVRTVREDPVIDGSLRRAMTYWKMVGEVFITDEVGRWLVGSRQYTAGQEPPSLPLLSDWSRRSLIANLRQIYVDRHDTELLRPIALVGETKPILVVHIVVSNVLIRRSLSAGVEDLSWIGAASLIASLILALVLPNFVLNPLERLSRRLDLMTAGTVPAAPAAGSKEAKEFAAVYSKLNILGQRFQGAREDVDQLRGNVEQLLAKLEETVMLFDASGRLTVAGTTVRTLLGVDPADITGRSVDEIFPALSELGGVVISAVRNGEAVTEQVVPWTTGGRDVSILVSVLPLQRGPDLRRIGALVTLRDAATRGELVAKLDVATRLTALSHLTRGVAHEIKNPLNAIRLHLEVLRSRLEEDPPELSVIAQEISRLDRVVKTFLDFNRPVEPHLRLLDLNEIALDISKLIQLDAASRNVNVKLVVSKRPAMINGDLDLLKQAVLNVVVNGVEAIHNGGLLTIETRTEKGRVEMSITDTGPGIPPEVQDKIFNLYFTTKNGGSGIGLAMAFRFVQLHDGKIEFSSKLGSGTTFRFSFPEAASRPNQRDIGLSKTQRA